MFDESGEPRESAPTGSSLCSAGTLKRIALVGTYPPRRCGIATFTSDLRSALTRAGNSCEILAISDKLGSYRYPDAVTEEIPCNRREGYSEAARRLEARGVDLVCIQHEFGIFGGAAGAHLLALLEELRCPVVTTLHTVLESPTRDQRLVTERLIARSARIVIMSQKGRDILQRAFEAPLSKIAIIPHGAPDHAFVRSASKKAQCQLEGRDVILTSGLLSPNKGVETMIRALPRVVSERPNALFVLVGATHPHLLAREGEAYRETLQSLAAELGVSRNVRFINAYVDTDELVRYLSAADVCVTPYLNEAQITSGTLAYALAIGKAIVSTPYWHAKELLRDGVGVLTPFGDPHALGEAVAGLLADERKREKLARRAYERGRNTIWAAVGKEYNRLFHEVGMELDAAVRRSSTSPPSLRAIERMSDDCGILQHARFAASDRNHGYCLDDNARALILTQRTPGRSLQRLAWIYAAFMEHAWNPDARRFRNFMSYDRRWLEEAGSEDSFGRAIWALGETARWAQDEELRGWAMHLAGRAVPQVASLTASRAKAFSVLGLCGLVAGADESLLRMVRTMANALRDEYLRSRRADWEWFEPWLAYDNARLPEALLRAGAALDDAALIECGQRALRWLTAMQTAPSGCFRPVGSRRLGALYAPPVQFDQQPLEAAATVDACWSAFDATGDRTWRNQAHRAFNWYFGANDLGVRMMTNDGGCYDGLGPEGPNRNQGAESILSFQLAAAAMRTRERGLPTETKPAGNRREVAHDTPSGGPPQRAPVVLAPTKQPAPPSLSP